jgi:hypothetical protein
MTTADEIVVLRIELQGIEPLIWRRVAVRTGMSLTGVHGVIQAAMGWLDSHLWEIEADSRRYAMRVPSEPEWNERYEDAGRATLAKVLNGGLQRMNYVYDIGDYWEHAIIVEKATASLQSMKYPEFRGGERRCPPEDCGGPQGFYEFLRNISNKNRKIRDEALRWYGGPYDPADIDEPTIVRALGKIAARRG